MSVRLVVKNSLPASASPYRLLDDRGREVAWPKLNYDMIPDFFQLPPGEHLVEPAGVAINSKGTFTFFIAANIH